MRYIFPLTTAVITCLVLFFMDEGYMDFSWMHQLRNWYFFLVYSGGLFLGQILIMQFFKNDTQDWWSKIVVYSLGIPLGLALSLFAFYMIALFNTAINSL